MRTTFCLKYDFAQQGFSNAFGLCLEESNLQPITHAARGTSPLVFTDSRTARTLEGCQPQPRGVRIPNAFMRSAMPRRVPPSNRSRVIISTTAADGCGI